MKEANNDLIAKWKSQIRKGMLDFIILLYLSREESYGYSLIRGIKRIISMNISEGTIYPLLNRLKNQHLISSKWVELETGTPRKYYQITEKGKKVLAEMIQFWHQFNSSINLFLEEQ